MRNSNSSFRAGRSGLNPVAILQDIATAWRLLWNPRVPFLMKLFLPILAIIYWFSPLDLMPGIPIDDLAVLILIAKLFVNMVPRDVMDQVQGGTARNRNNTNPSSYTDAHDDANTVSTTWRVIDDE